MKQSLVILIMTIATTAYSQDFDALSLKLERYLDESVAARQSVMSTMRQFGFESRQMDSINHMINFRDSLHLNFVINVISDYGWLGISQIGKKANSSIFLAVNQAPNDGVRMTYYPLLEESALANESSQSEMALMKDRILVDQKIPQEYGTQWNYEGELEVLFPISEPSKVNKKRELVGLPKLADRDIVNAQQSY